jgi:hypothetical protein
VSFSDLDGLPLLASFYCFELAPEAVDESWPNGFPPTCKLPPALPLFKFVSIDTSFCQRILRLGSVSFVKPLLHSLIAKVSAISKPVRACPLDDHRLVSVASTMGRLAATRAQ